ncbi:hypothetical protein C8R44DRAFT_896211 [Mycena epipterygia]|nr:hypothetical protein C8R44DRAFT_896211 [Mycena epipterygia]
MSLTLPIEAMSRLQVSFKVLLPDGSFSFDMAPNSTPCSTSTSELKLHFQGTRDKTGGVTFTVWVSGLESNGDTPNSDISRHRHTPSPNYLPQTDPLFVQTPEIFPPSPDDDSAVIASTSHARNPITELMGIFDDDDPCMTGWPFLDVNQDLQEISLSHYSDTTYLDMAPPLGEPTTSPSSCISPCPTAISFDAVAGPGSDHSTSACASPSHSVDSTSPDTPSSSSAHSDASPAACPSSPGSLELSSAPAPDPSRPFKCLHADCPLWFKRLYTRRVHMNTHLPGSGRDRRFACTFSGCDMKFSRKHDRLRHEVGGHGMGTQWTCAPCNKFFSTQTTLERHYLDKHNLPGFKHPTLGPGAPKGV